MYHTHPRIAAHPHTSILMPAIQAVSMNSIIFSQVPSIETVLSKLSSSINDEFSWPASSPHTKAQVNGVISSTVLPYLRSRFLASNPPKVLPSATPAILSVWAQVSCTIASNLPVDSLFPLVDLWRLAFLDPAVGSWTASLTPTSPASDPVSNFLPKAIAAQDTPTKGARNYVLTVLRLLCNAFSSPPLARRLLRADARENVTAVLVPSLLHADALVRTASASLAFDIAAVLQRERVDCVRTGKGIQPDSEGDLGDWQVEVVTAILEALDREKENEEVGE